MLWGISLQFVLALIVIRWSAGYAAIQWIGDRIVELLAYTDVGCVFVFGESYEDHYYAFKVSTLKIST